MNVEEASRQLAVLGSPTRLEIYRLLVKAGAEGAPVGTLQEVLGIPGSTLSHHIGKLVVAGQIDLAGSDRASLLVRYLPDGGLDPTPVLMRYAIEGFFGNGGSQAYVLRAMDVPRSCLHGSIRFSLSRYNTDEDVDLVLEKLPPIIQRLRELSPFAND